MTENESLIAKAKQGDRGALQALLEPLQLPVVRFLQRFVRTPDAQDVAQETFIQVVRKFSQFGGRSSLQAWVFRIAFRQMINFQNKNNRQMQVIEECEPALADDAQQSVLQSEQNGLILAAIDRLPEKQRQVVWLRVFEELPFREIAKICGVPLNTVLSRMHQAKEKLIGELASLGIRKEVIS